MYERETRKPLKNKQQSDMSVNSSPFRQSEYLITTTKQIMSLPIENAIGLTQSYTISDLRYL